MCYPVCGMVHIKDSLLLIEKSSQCCGSSGNTFLFYPIELFLLCVGFPILLSGPLTYVQRHTNMGVIWWGTGGGGECLPHVWLWGEQYLISPHQIFLIPNCPPPFSMPMHTTVNVLSVLLKPFPSFGSLINSTSDAMSWKEPQTYLKHPFQSVMCRGMVLSFRCSKYSLLQR